MSCFLKLPDQSLIMVDYNPRNGLYYQTFKEDQSSRPSVLLSNGTHEYIAFLDEKNHFHVIAKNSRNQIIHFKESSNRIIKDTILDDHNNEFKIDNLYALSSKDQIHLFYYADHPSTKATQLIYHLLKEPMAPPKPLGTMIHRDINYDCIRYKNSIFLGMIDKKEEDYRIQINSLTPHEPEWQNLFTPVTSTFPITYCKLSIDKLGTYHLLYVQEQYGQYQILYKNKTSQWSKEHLIYSCGYPIKPVMLLYYDALWINWRENNLLKTILSVDGGNSFSKPIQTSMQNSNISLHSYDASQETDIPLICNQLYGISYPSPKFTVLHSLDMDGIHSNMTPNSELKLYLNNIKNQLKLSVTKSALEEENLRLQYKLSELNQVQDDITSQYNELASLTKKIQDEGKKWRDLYNEAKTETEFYKKRAKQLEKSISTATQNTPQNTLDVKESNPVSESEENTDSGSSTNTKKQEKN